MAAQALARAERNDEAKTMLQHGIECARRTRNQHALSEMEAMLDELGGWHRHSFVSQRSKPRSNA